MALHYIGLKNISDREHQYYSDGGPGGILEDNYWGNISKYLTDQEKDRAVEMLKGQLKRGDIVKIMEAQNYRDDGMLIYDGKSLIPMFQPSEWVSPPSSFLVGDEFLADHWVKSINHNYIVWINHTRYRDELLRNLEDTHTSFTTHLGTFTIDVITEHDIGDAMVEFKADLEKNEPVQLISYDFISGNSCKVDPYSMYYHY